MIRVIATALVLTVGAVTNALAIVAVPGPDIESGLLAMSVVGGLVYVINRRRKKL